MKRFIGLVRRVGLVGLVVLVGNQAAGSTNTTVVVFPLRTWAAGGLNRGLVLTPVYSPLTDGSNVFWGQPLKFQPTNGVVSARLVPNDYDVSLEGVSGMWRISVPATNRVMWATECTTNVTSYSYGATHQTEWPWAAITNAPDAMTNGQWLNAGLIVNAFTNIIIQNGPADPVAFISFGHMNYELGVVDSTGVIAFDADQSYFTFDLPIHADGSSLYNLLPSSITDPPWITSFAQGVELFGSFTGTLAGSGVGITNVPSFATTGRAVYSTNANSGGVIDSTLPYQLFVTNASMTVSGFSGLTNGRQHVLSMTVSNSSASAITWNGPPTAFYIGASSSAALSIPAGKEGVVSFWVWPSVRTNVCNAVQQ